MDSQDIQALTDRVIARLFLELEASGRHVHVTREQAITLFGHELTPERPLSQPGQYLARERVSVTGSKGTAEHVAVLGPPRKEAQVELSFTDARTLGIPAPVRLSGDIQGTPGAVLTGPCGQVRLERGAIVAQRHVHLTPEDAERFGVKDGQSVRLQTYTGRPLIFEQVAVRVSPDFASRVHLDFDEANACGFHSGDLGRILS